MPSLRSHTHGRHLPHMSYAVLRTWDLVAVSAAVAGLGAVAPVELTFDGVGLFRRGRAWLLAGASAEFLTRQEPQGEGQRRGAGWRSQASGSPSSSLAAASASSRPGRLRHDVLADLELDVLAGFVLARHSAGLADSTIRGTPTIWIGAPLVRPAVVGDGAA